MLRAAIRSSLPALRPAFSQGSPSLLFRRLLSEQARSQIQSAVTASPVVLFMKGNPQIPQCGFSRAVVQILDLHQVSPEKMKTYDVLEDSELRSGIKEFSEWPTIPQLYVNGEFVGGCDILMSMHQSGELEQLLERHGVIPKLAAEEPQSAQS
ncbi:hypothetical protein SERLA73DRAFT_175425 [Serpula lacrymans var. lacrymans S7.3]|uniref:Monothiol glutaredoxin-5, mitochondrial n=2 Tax=Serpula lacrymans var. lacrymans TaxID=341189 RepID=F8PJW6_SERL3|nr:uncharacterized protein SERLADRAFT_457685 [Serpula lacrymans var. lacrymans S7.9]EGO03788.1 hypothetical protein SERLA73DRAFT_175425 [Serpula lacrymans var. lacrymans S7.3]EGO29650.1 hypothetical protein SERLADRAFT_457685 [Serpula lacrymans var. lacrymans S7.9]